MCKSKELVILTPMKSKPQFFSSDKREKIEILKGYCRDKGLKLYIEPWVLAEDIDWFEEE